VYANLYCVKLGELQKVAEVVKMPKNMRYAGTRSFKVIELATNRIAYTVTAHKSHKFKQLVL